MAGWVPSWGRRGPGWKVRRYAATRDGMAGGSGWRLLAEHIRVVWENQRLMGVVQGRGPGVAGEIEFGARIGRHVLACGRCSSDAGLRLWSIALPFAGVDDVVGALRLEGPSQPRSLDF